MLVEHRSPTQIWIFQAMLSRRNAVTEHLEPTWLRNFGTSWCGDVVMCLEFSSSLHGAPVCHSFLGCIIYICVCVCRIIYIYIIIYNHIFISWDHGMKPLDFVQLPSAEQKSAPVFLWKLAQGAASRHHGGWGLRGRRSPGLQATKIWKIWKVISLWLWLTNSLLLKMAQSK